MARNPPDSFAELNCFDIDGPYPTCDAARCANGLSTTLIANRLRLFQWRSARFAARFANPEASASAPTAAMPARAATTVVVLFIFRNPTAAA